MFLYLRLLGESLRFAFNELAKNKLRTFLSILGVTIGIFSIIAVLSAVDSLKRNITKNLETIDNSIIYFTKIPFGPTEIPRWKREQFPNVSYDEYLFLKKNMPYTAEVAFSIFVQPESIRYEDNTVTQVNIVPITHEQYNIQSLKFVSGRFYSEVESSSGAPVIVLGYEVAQNLFGNLNPIGKIIRIYGQKVTVIGMLDKQGASLFGSNDEAAFLPSNFVRRIVGSNNRNVTNAIILKPSKEVPTDEYIALLTQNIRNHRGMTYETEDNFFITELAGFTDFIDNITGQMSMIGLFISLFSLLVGGFGIANIMFVSVKERTSLIGIQKSLGAKSRFVLFQFLFEAVILALVGGGIGLILVWIVSIIASGFTGDFEFVVSLFNLTLGTLISAAIGVISGIIPAISASRLDPVEAIRTGM
ncbi:MAG: ABC transporter permease [Bacteroidetes bacterium]|nr:ABC transporter permease [Bacteroidota bacterium]